MRAIVQILFLLRRLVLRTLRIRTRGVKVMVFNRSGELLLIRNSYGDRAAFVFPGGGIRRFETPQAAAAREVAEETGLTVSGLTLRSIHLSRREGKRDTVYLFSAAGEGIPRVAPLEVEDAGFFPLDALPRNVSDAVTRRLAELRGDGAPDPLW